MITSSKHTKEMEQVRDENNAANKIENNTEGSVAMDGNGNVTEDKFDIEKIIEEYYDPNVTMMSEEEMEEIIKKYGGENTKEAFVFDIEKIIEEYYDPGLVPLTHYELEEILAKYVDETVSVDDNKFTVDDAVGEENDVLEDVENNPVKRKRLRRRVARRGGRSKRKSKDKVDLKILHSNCDGYTSKKESIEDIIKERETDVLLLNETALKGKRKIRMRNYFSFCKNRVKAKGGVATVVSNYLRPYTVRVCEGKEQDEYIITRLDHVIPAVNIVNIYGQQESRTDREQIMNSWGRLRDDMEDILKRGEALLVLGDMNVAIGADELGVAENNAKISFGGQLLREFIEENNLKVLNNLAEGGPWTWIQRGKVWVKSCLDLAISSQNLLPFVKSVVIDENQRFTPRRVIWKQNKFTSVYTDHFSLEVILCDMPRRKMTMEKSSTWNLGKPDGWKAYKELTDKAAGKIEALVDKDDIDIEEAIRKISAIDNEIKFTAFGKTRSKSMNKKVIVDKARESDDLDLLKRQSQKIENEILRIKSQKLGRTGNIFKMKEVITGPKKGNQEPTAIRDPNDGELVVSNEEIKKVTLDYCVQNLTTKSKDPKTVEIRDMRKNMHFLRMEEEDSEGLEIEWEDFEEVVNKFASKSTKSYDFLLKSGENYKQVMFKLCRKMINKEEFPSLFRRTLLYMIWKQKGSAEILKNSRFIHLKEGFLPRTCEALVVGKMKSDILKSSSKYQVGGQPGHAPEEHIFTIKSIWALLEKQNAGMIITLVDIVAFFDREDIYDVMETLHKIGTNKKAARVWYKLNEGTEISVKTASGVTETAYVGDCIGQGTAGGALVSQANLDLGLTEYFEHSKEEIYYGNIRLQPLAYQDDILKGSKDVLEAQVGNIRLTAMFKDKGLEAHPDKTCFIVCGSRNYKNKVAKDLEQNPLVFEDFPVKQKICDRYLGQMLHGLGLDESAEATVKERKGRIKGAALEIKSIIEEFQMQAMGGMIAAYELWERALVPSLLSGAGTWFGTDGGKAAIDLCDQIQNFYWRVMLSVPESCPKLALRCETGMLGMKWRIWQEKLLLLLRIKQQDMNTLSRQVYEEGKANGWPGLGAEVATICEEIGIKDINNAQMTKQNIKSAIFEHHLADLKGEMEKATGKLAPIKNDDFRQVQDYFHIKSVETCRMAFRVRTQLVKDIPGNFKNKYRRKGTDDSDAGLRCEYCNEGEVMTQSHCMVCPAWAELRMGMDLTDIKDLVIFFRRVLEERTRMERKSV